MKSKYFFFIALIGIATISVQQANSQVGPETYRGDTYQDDYYGFGIHVWTGGLPEWLHDYTTWEGKKIYVPYKTHETDDYITYESASITLTLSKTSCDVKLYDKGKVAQNEEPLISSLSHVVKEAKNGTDAWIDSAMNSDDCDVEIQQNPDGIKAIVTKSNTNGTFKTIYDASLSKRDLEWTWEYENKNAQGMKYGFTSTCEGKSCNKIIVNGTTVSQQTQLTKDEVIKSSIMIDTPKKDLVFDSKNKIHDFLWMIKLENGKTVMDFTDAKNELPIGKTLTVDPTFGYTAGTTERIYSALSVAATCNATVGGSDGTAQVDIPASGANEDCEFLTLEWDISSIPTNSIISDATIRYDIGVPTNARPCDWVHVSDRPSTAANQVVYDGFVLGTYSTYQSATTGCQTQGSDKTLDLGTSADADIQSSLSLDWYAVGVKQNPITRDASAHTIPFSNGGGSSTDIQITYYEPAGPSITASPLINSVNVFFFPNATQAETTSYRIDRSTTVGDTCTSSSYSTIVTDTGNNNTSYLDTNVLQGNCYSYRVYSYIGTVLSTPSNLANATLFDLTSSNTNMVDIGFERININSSALRLNVTYTIPANLTCNFYYSLEGTNRSYYNIPSIIIDSTHNESSFLFLDANDDIITAQCDDVDSNATASYIITQTNFPLQEQIADFRNGDFGTMGKIGAIDLVTLIVIILAMVGLNRVNESVGGIFMVIIVGVMSYFGFVQWVTFLTTAIAVGLLWTISTTRKT